MLRVLADENARPGRSLGLSSTSPDLDRPGRSLALRSTSPDLAGLTAESPAGRVTLVELGGFRLTDIGTDSTDTLWVARRAPPVISGR